MTIWERRSWKCCSVQRTKHSRQEQSLCTCSLCRERIFRFRITLSGNNDYHLYTVKSKSVLRKLVSTFYKHQKYAILFKHTLNKPMPIFKEMAIQTANRYLCWQDCLYCLFELISSTTACVMIYTFSLFPILPRWKTHPVRSIWLQDTLSYIFPKPVKELFCHSVQLHLMQ